jgi:hypothetical protein
VNSKPCLCGAPGCMAVRRPRECARDFRERKYASLACAGSSGPMSAQELATIDALKAEGMGYRKIAARIGRSVNAVQRALRRHTKPAPHPAERPPRDEGASDRLLRALRRHPRPAEMTGVMRGMPVRLLSDRGAWA